MATLHVRSFPDPLYRQLARLAEEDHRTLSAEVVVLLKRELHARPKSQNVVLAELDRLRFRPARAVPSSLKLLRKDRRR